MDTLIAFEKTNHYIYISKQRSILRLMYGRYSTSFLFKGENVAIRRVFGPGIYASRGNFIVYVRGDDVQRNDDGVCHFTRKYDGPFGKVMGTDRREVVLAEISKCGMGHTLRTPLFSVRRRNKCIVMCKGIMP